MIAALAGLTMGLVGSAHCAGMCGGIAGAISVGPARSGASLSDPARRAAAGNAGRVASYTLAGAVAGGAGAEIAGAAGEGGMVALRVIAALMLIAAGMHVGGWSTPIARLERAGFFVWRRIAPLARRVRASDSTLAPFLFGVLWGWIPCGLVYSALAIAGAAGSATGGALVMAGFGIGTLPSTLAVGVLTGGSARVAASPVARFLAGAVMIAFGLWSLAATLPVGGEVHDGSCHGATAALQRTALRSRS